MGLDSSLKVHILPILQDNYTYLLTSEGHNRCMVIDPGEASSVLNYLDEYSLELTQIWITHHHPDHIGGVGELREITRCEVIGPEKEASLIPSITHKVADLDFIEFESYKAKVLEVPGHTLGHVAYWFYQDKLLFPGDTLFSLGCGRNFEGTAQQMWSSLCKLRALPEDTLIYSGHEYTLSNSAFALSVDPNNEDLIRFQREALDKRSQDEPTYPSLLKDEILANPFLRADLPYWKEFLNLKPSTLPHEIFQILRDKKNKFKA